MPCRDQWLGLSNLIIGQLQIDYKLIIDISNQIMFCAGSLCSCGLNVWIQVDPCNLLSGVATEQNSPLVHNTITLEGRIWPTKQCTILPARNPAWRVAYLLVTIIVDAILREKKRISPCKPEICIHQHGQKIYNQGGKENHWKQSTTDTYTSSVWQLQILALFMKHKILNSFTIFV